MWKTTFVLIIAHYRRLLSHVCLINYFPIYTTFTHIKVYQFYSQIMSEKIIILIGAVNNFFMPLWTGWPSLKFFWRSLDLTFSYPYEILLISVYITCLLTFVNMNKWCTSKLRNYWNETASTHTNRAKICKSWSLIIASKLQVLG